MNEKLAALKKKKKKTSRDYSKITDLLTTFKEIQSQVFEKRLSAWNSLFNSILQKFFGDIGFSDFGIKCFAAVLFCNFLGCFCT